MEDHPETEDQRGEGRRMIEDHAQINGPQESKHRRESQDRQENGDRPLTGSHREPGDRLEDGPLVARDETKARASHGHKRAKISQ